MFVKGVVLYILLYSTLYVCKGSGIIILYSTLYVCKGSGIIHIII